MDTLLYPRRETARTPPWRMDGPAAGEVLAVGTANRALWLQIDGIDSAVVALARVPNLIGLRRRGVWGGNAIEEGDAGRAALSRAGDPLRALLSAAHNAGRQTALVAGQRHVRRWLAPEGLDHFSFPGASSWAVAQETASLLDNARPDLCSAQFCEPETVALRHGWGSREHRAAIEECDAALAVILNALVRTAAAGEALLVITARRGFPRDYAATPGGLPWLCVGPGTPRIPRSTTPSPRPIPRRSSPGRSPFRSRV